MSPCVCRLTLFGAARFAMIASLGAQSSVGGAEAGPVGTPERPRLVSSRMAAVLAAALPKLEPAKSEAGAIQKPTAPDREDAKPANGIVRLPRYLVREPKLPTRLEVMARAELEHYAMEKYIGPEDGIDRGVLNLFTIAGLWKKIPLLGHFPFVGSETNEARGMRLYEEAERKRKMEELMGLMSLTRESGDAAGADQIKREADKTFIRSPDFGK